MSSALRKEVLQGFKMLHKTRKLIFKGDNFALEAGRQRINDEYKKNKHVEEQHIIAELVQHAKAIETELKTTVIQAKEVSPGKYEAKITPGTIRIDNVPYNDCGYKGSYVDKKDKN